MKFKLALIVVGFFGMVGYIVYVVTSGQTFYEKNLINTELKEEGVMTVEIPSLHLSPSMNVIRPILKYKYLSYASGLHVEYRARLIDKDNSVVWKGTGIIMTMPKAGGKTGFHVTVNKGRANHAMADMRISKPGEYIFLCNIKLYDGVLKKARLIFKEHAKGFDKRYLAAFVLLFVAGIVSLFIGNGGTKARLEE